MEAQGTNSQISRTHQLMLVVAELHRGLALALPLRLQEVESEGTGVGVVEDGALLAQQPLLLVPRLRDEDQLHGAHRAILAAARVGVGRAPVVPPPPLSCVRVGGDGASGVVIPLQRRPFQLLLMDGGWMDGWIRCVPLECVSPSPIIQHVLSAFCRHNTITLPTQRT